MNYIDTLAYEIIDEVSPATCAVDLARLYALLALTLDEYVSPEDVHDAWAAWKAGIDPAHPDLVPFDELSPEAQAKDNPFSDAIRIVARRMRGK